MADESKKKYVVTAADVGRFFIIAGLGIASIVTFLWAGTIVLYLAIHECQIDFFNRNPPGLMILGILGILFLTDIIIESVDAPTVIQKWYKESDRNRQFALLLLISLIAFWLVI